MSMVNLDKPLCIRFALSVDSKLIVHTLKKGYFVFFFVGILRIHSIVYMLNFVFASSGKCGEVQDDYSG